MLKLTVITATRNVIVAKRKEMLLRCVKSVDGLKTPHEHLIIDGASDDGTVGVLSELSGLCKEMKFISEPDSGIYSALNKGVERAQGEWIYVIGCDDYLHAPGILDEVLSKYGNSRYDMLISPVAGYDNNVNLKSCLYSIPYCHQGLLMRRDLVFRLGCFDESLKLAGDYALTLKAHLGIARHVVVSPRFKPYATYTVGGASCISRDRLFKESAVVAGRIFCLTDREIARFELCRVLPMRILLPLLFHGNPMIRRGALWGILRSLGRVMHK